MVLKLASYIGAGIIRDSLPSSPNYAIFSKIYQQGIRLNAVAGGATDETAFGKQVQVSARIIF